jgi:hypothetical protein
MRALEQASTGTLVASNLADGHRRDVDEEV